MSAQDELLTEVEAFLTRTGMRPTAFGLNAVGDGNFVKELRDGVREFRRAKIEKARSFIRDHDQSSLAPAV